MSIGQLIEELCVANIKLFVLCDKKAKVVQSPANFSKGELVEMTKRDLELCKRRAKLKHAIDKTLNDAILVGEMAVIDEVKQYG